METLRNALRSLSRKKFRTSLTVLGIAIGIGALVLISGIGQVGKRLIGDELGSMGIDGISVTVDKNQTNFRLGQKQLSAVRQMEQVESAIPIMVNYSQVSAGGRTMQSVLWGIDQGADNVFHIEALYGRLFNSGDIKRGAKVCIVDTAFAKSLYGRENIVGKEIKVNLTSGPATYTVVGVASSGGNLMQGVLSSYIPTFLYVPYTSMGLTDSAQSSFDQIAVKVSGNVPFETASKELKATLERQIGEENVIKTENISKQKEQLNSILDTVTALLTVIGSIALVVAGLSIMTVMLVSVSERTREIGIKKAIGATRFIILKDFLAEAVVLSLMGSAIGAGAGVLLTVGGCLLVGLPPIIDWQMILIAIGFSVAMGTLFGVYPAMQAAKLRPVEAFRQE